MADRRLDATFPTPSRLDPNDESPAKPQDEASSPERFPEVTPDGEHSVRGGYDRFGNPDPSQEDGGADQLLQQDEQAAREEAGGRRLNPQFQRKQKKPSR